MNVMRITASFVVLVAVVAGCSNSASRYEDVETLAAALLGEELGCEDLSQPDINAKGRGLPSSSGSCEVEGEDVQLFVFETEEDANLWFTRGRMQTVTTVRGPSWVVVTITQDLADRIAATLAGNN